MKPARFDYFRPDSVDQALALLARYGEDARILAGGQSLMPLVNMRLAQPAVLIDISRLDELDYVRTSDTHLVVGAACTQSSLERRASLAREVPLLALALPFVAHTQIRNRGTVCGSIAHADPSAELPLVLAALGGEIALRSLERSRVLPAQAFFTGALSTAREADELIEAVRFPLAAPGSVYRFDEVALRHGDFALTAVALVSGQDEHRLAVGGVEDRPVVACIPRGDAEGGALAEFVRALAARDDQHAGADYRRRVTQGLAQRMLEAAHA